MKENIVLFYGKLNPEFSNFYLAPFRVDGKEYASAEHYFMYQKALLFDPNGLAIRKMSNDLAPSQMKKLGRQVKNFDAEVWKKKSLVYMYQAVRAKFLQNPDLAEKLLATGYAVLAEASPYDRRWGIGMGISNPDVMDPYKWRGSNWLGAILMAVRGELRHDTSEIGDCCYYGPDVVYTAQSGDTDAPLFIEGKPNWKLLLRGFYRRELDGYADIFEFERHFTFSAILNTGVLDAAYDHKIDLEDFL